MRKVANMDDVDRGLRDLRREIDRLTNGGLIMAKDLDMRGFRILNIGNPEDFGDVPSQTQTEETVADAGTGTGTSGDVSGPGVSVAGAIAYFDDTSGTSLASGSATITSAGAISATSLALTTALPVTSGGTGRLTSTTAYALLAAGTTATGAHQTLAAGATTELLVGGGASALPVWTTATGSGAPVRANTPTLVTPVIGAATGTSLDLSGGGGSISLAQAQSVWLGGSGSGSRIRQNASANMVMSRGGTDYAVLSAGALSPNTNGGTDLGLTGTRWGAGYFSGLVRASSLNLTLGGTELALATDEVAMFTSRAGSSNDAWLAVNSGANAYGGIRHYDDGVLGGYLRFVNTGGEGLVQLATENSAAVALTLNSTGDVASIYDTAGLKLLQLAGTSGTTGIETALRFIEYRGLALEGNGVPSLRKENISTTKTANFTAASLTPPATAGRYRVGAVLTTTSATNTGTLQVTVDYVDSQGTTHTADVLPLVDAAGAIAASVTSAASKEFKTVGQEITINNSGTAIVLKVVITGTVSYTVAPYIEQIG